MLPVMGAFLVYVINFAGLALIFKVIGARKVSKITVLIPLAPALLTYAWMAT